MVIIESGIEEDDEDIETIDPSERRRREQVKRALQDLQRLVKLS